MSLCTDFAGILQSEKQDSALSEATVLEWNGQSIGERTS